MKEPTQPPVIRVAGVAKRFRRTQPGDRLRTLKSALIGGARTRDLPRDETIVALEEVSFEVARGECFGLIGGNGSGKSTLLKLVAGMLRPTLGEVAVSGRVAALIELGAGFHPEISGRENVYINGAVLGLSRREIDKRYRDIVEFSGLSDFMEEPVKNYSSGMYVRLGFAVAIHTNPEVLLVDEVLAVGDAAFAHRCIRRLEEFLASGRTLLLVSHSLDLVADLCDRVLWLDRGHQRLTGDPRRVIDAYRQSVAEQEGAEHFAAKRQREAALLAAEAAPAGAAPAAPGAATAASGGTATAASGGTATAAPGGTATAAPGGVATAPTVPTAPAGTGTGATAAAAPAPEAAASATEGSAAPAAGAGVAQPAAGAADGGAPGGEGAAAASGEESAEVLRWGSRQAEVLAVRLLGPDGVERYHLQSGERAVFEIRARAAQPLTDFVFGIAINTPRGFECWGTNTDMEGFVPERLDGEVQVRVTCPALRLAPGEYAVDIAVHARDGAPYDYHRRVLGFTVTAENQGAGVYFPEHRWEFDGAVSWGSTPDQAPR